MNFLTQKRCVPGELVVVRAVQDTQPGLCWALLGSELCSGAAHPSAALRALLWNLATYSAFISFQKHGSNRQWGF